MSAEIVQLSDRRPKSDRRIAGRRPTEEEIRHTLYKCWSKDGDWYRIAFAHRLRLVRAALSISENEAADAFGVTLRTYRNYERAGPTRSNHGIYEFGRTFSLSLDWLLAGKEPVLQL
jgi:DNA-binding XRE family transcriptional regulator